jgi:hypothetical protein
MYINPFLAGVIATVFVEIGGIVVWAAVEAFKRGKRHGN